MLNGTCIETEGEKEKREGGRPHVPGVGLMKARQAW